MHQQRSEVLPKHFYLFVTFCKKWAENIYLERSSTNRYLSTFARKWIHVILVNHERQGEFCLEWGKVENVPKVLQRAARLLDLIYYRLQLASSQRIQVWGSTENSHFLYTRV